MRGRRWEKTDEATCRDDGRALHNVHGTQCSYYEVAYYGAMESIFQALYETMLLLFIVYKPEAANNNTRKQQSPIFCVL